MRLFHGHSYATTLSFHVRSFRRPSKREAHGLFPKELSTNCYLVLLLLSIYSTLSFPHVHLVAAYVFFFDSSMFFSRYYT